MQKLVNALLGQSLSFAKYVIATAALTMLILGPVLFVTAYAQPGPSAEVIKGVLETPIALFVLMLAGSLGSILKKMVAAKKSDEVYVHYWPETLLMLGGNVAGFLVLLMSDQLNFASVILGGYTANSLASLSRPADLRA